ncbi:unnamed protein product, partial [Brassica rapa subsp. narinosa]
VPHYKHTKCRLRRADSGSPATSSKYGGVKKTDPVALSELNSYILNSPQGTGETQCSDHTNGHLMMFQLLKDFQPAPTQRLHILIQS